MSVCRRQPGVARKWACTKVNLPPLRGCSLQRYTTQGSERVNESIQPRSGEEIVAQGVSPGSTMPEGQAPKGRQNRLICRPFGACSMEDDSPRANALGYFLVAASRLGKSP